MITLLWLAFGFWPALFRARRERLAYEKRVREFNWDAS